MNPFRLFGRILFAMFKISALFVVFVVEVVASLATGGKSRLGDAVGEFGRAVVDTIGETIR